MYKTLTFYNEYGAGDIFESREFIKELSNKIPAEKYKYAHGKSKRILADLPWVEQIDFDKSIMDSMKDVVDDKEGNIYINTWIGRDGQYVLPGIGCTVEQIHRMYNDILRKYGVGQLDLNPVNYIPRINYTYFERMNIHKFLSEHKKDRILISNGPVQSNQSFNFDFTDAIYELASKFKDKVFIVTVKLPEERDNIFYTGDITKVNENDLNEVSYLSKFCSTIIGRNSGPHVFSQTIDNCMDASKKFISFTYQKTGSSFVVNTQIKAQKYWSPVTDSYGVARFIEECLG
jgi:hypothetical protein